MNRTIRVILVFLAGLILTAGIAAAIDVYIASPDSKRTLVFSDKAMLMQLYDSYKHSFVQTSSGRTIDTSQPGQITTSEG